MNRNERLLAIALGAVILCLGLFFGYGYYAAAVKFRQDKIDDISRELKTKKQEWQATVKATTKVNEYEDRSLPPDPALARSLYQHWLLTKVQEAGLRDQVVTPTGQRPVGDVFVQQTFTVNGKGRYEQVVKLLDDIYRIDLLHRVSRLSLKPIKDSKDLEMSLTLDAVSMRTAPEATKLQTRTKQLRLDSAEKYQLAIVGRNIFAPANQAPRISGAGKQKGQTNRSVDIAVKASDPDPLDFVKLELTKIPKDATGARMDSSGKLSWTPKKTGEYEFEVTAIDDNFPPRVSTEKLVVSVTDPPPPPPRDDRPPPPKEEKLAFDHAKHTVLTAVIEVGGEGEVWLFVRPTATTFKLHQGETFEIGSMKGKIEEIGASEFVYLSSAKETKGKHLRVARGEFLEQAVQVTIPTSTEAPSDSEEPTEEKPAEKKPTARQPEKTPAEDEPAEKPATEKPAEEKPSAETPATDKPAVEPKADPEPKAVADLPAKDSDAGKSPPPPASKADEPEPE